MTTLNLPAADERPAAYWENPDSGEIVPGPPDSPENHRMVVRASGLGQCTWELAALLQGHTPEPHPQAIQLAFLAGRIAEGVVLERLYGPELRWEPDENAAQAEGQLAVGRNRIVRFHPDGVATSHLDGVRRIIEVKALSRANFERARVHGVHSLGYGYDWQASVQMHALRLPLVYVLLEKPDGFNPEDPDLDALRGANLAMQYVDEPPRSRAEIVQRVKEIYDAAVGDDVVLSGRPCDRPDQWPCLFRSLRPEPEDALPAPPDSHVEEVELLIRRYLEGKATEERGKQQKEQARAALLEIADELGVRSGGLATSAGRVRISRSVTKRIDTKALAADGLLEKYQREGNERVTVTVEAPEPKGAEAAG